MKVYQIFFTDEYNNNYDLGFFKNLDDAVPAVNEMLFDYDFQVQKGQLTEKAGMFDSYIDCYISDLFSEEDYEREEYLELGSMMIRGFIFDSDKLIEEIKRVVEE